MDDQVGEGHFINYLGNDLDGQKEGLQKLYASLQPVAEKLEASLTENDLQTGKGDENIEAMPEQEAKTTRKLPRPNSDPQPPVKISHPKSKAQIIHNDIQTAVQQVFQSLEEDDPRWPRILLCYRSFNADLLRILADKPQGQNQSCETMQTYELAPAGLGIKRLKRAEERGGNTRRKLAAIPLSNESPEKQENRDQAEPFKPPQKAKRVEILEDAVQNQTQHEHRKALAAQRKKNKENVPPTNFSQRSDLPDQEASIQTESEETEGELPDLQGQCCLILTWNAAACLQVCL